MCRLLQPRMAYRASQAQLRLCEGHTECPNALNMRSWPAAFRGSWRASVNAEERPTISKRRRQLIGAAMTNSLLVAAAVAAILLSIPIAASAAQTTMTSAHSPRAETIQKADYNWHHRQWHYYN
jgi:hypothetical protein